MTTRFGQVEGKCEVCRTRVGYDIEVIAFGSVPTPRLAPDSHQLVRLTLCDKCRHWLAEELLGAAIEKPHRKMSPQALAIQAMTAALR